MYDAATNLVAANPINRYAINTQIPGLNYGPGGSLTITLSAAQPAEPDANWLPSPAGPFYIVLRMYGPIQPAAGSFQPPPVTPQV